MQRFIFPFQLSRSPYLEGRWNFEWLGSGTPAAAQFILEYALFLPLSLVSVINATKRTDCALEVFARSERVI